MCNFHIWTVLRAWILKNFTVVKCRELLGLVKSWFRHTEKTVWNHAARNPDAILPFIFRPNLDVCRWMYVRVSGLSGHSVKLHWWEKVLIASAQCNYRKTKSLKYLSKHIHSLPKFWTKKSGVYLIRFLSSRQQFYRNKDFVKLIFTVISLTEMQISLLIRHTTSFPSSVKMHIVSCTSAIL